MGNSSLHNNDRRLVFVFGIVGRCGKSKATPCGTTIEYYPPHGFSPVDVLIMHRGHRATLHDIFNPLILYWADRGFIEIEEDCKRGLKLTKLKELCRPKKSRIKLYNLSREIIMPKKTCSIRYFRTGKSFIR